MLYPLGGAPSNPAVVARCTPRRSVPYSEAPPVVSHVSLSSSIVLPRWYVQRSEGGGESQREPPSLSKISSWRRHSRIISNWEYATSDIGGRIVAILLRYDHLEARFATRCSATIWWCNTVDAIWWWMPRMFRDCFLTMTTGGNIAW